MEALVLNVTNWIGYHLADCLLKEGYQVKGVKGEEENDHLMDFFSRNSEFEWVDLPSRGSFPLVFCPGDPPDSADIEAEQFYLINSKGEQLGTHGTTVQVPYLFGEWMPLTEEGFYYNEKKIEFSSEEFKNNGLYIGDFLQLILTWVVETPPSDRILLFPARNTEKQVKKLEKTFPVEENVPIEESVQQVISHYKQFKILYPRT